MTLKTLLRQLRDSCKILRTIEQSLIKYEHQERARLQREMHPKPKSIFPETFHVDPGRVALESVVSDLAIATNLVSQYQAVLCGEPLSFHGIDAYTSAMDEDPNGPINAFFGCGGELHCDQGQPCDYCRKHHKNCVYDAGQDARRPAVRKRRNEDLQYRSRALDTILDTLKTAPPAQAHRVLELIRQDQPLDHIISSISLLQTASARGRTGSNHTRDRLAIDVLCDAPPIQVPASPWTSITSGSDTASHLMSAYFNWCHFYYYFFDEQLFLEGMRQADLNSPYCSPLMVNACLGIGCLFTDDPCAFSDAADPSTRGQHFFNEAHRLWTETAACATLANVSGLLLLIMLFDNPTGFSMERADANAGPHC
ncbi:uncharacterized protein HMPREF1541_10776 [Cyphellophora europaea CBS 101466]|uniref:Xylanolytic transcriptional activator regulatory domain-containing protein n=1 Tax=Cyphellophora europaea (strain CBS 101466) TaxID=1220924 RepID=W2S6G9_CYPE1|nr:uncharacterized protein HMPREF1541_10776 [Cyphellophora europaea CBS 101466]ETN44225.1 hypothetical protein HMPREF1541_10776 [Cyphellophora europaea CBS 101466]